MVGVAWEQHVTFLDSRSMAQGIVRKVRDQVQTVKGHAALLAVAVGNEIPAPIVRWHGPKRVARFIERLCRAVKKVDRDILVTYVSYPTTEYLELPFLDFLSFNVFLEHQERLTAYLARLQKHRRTPAAGADGSRARQHPQRRRQASGNAAVADPNGIRRWLRRACACFLGPIAGFRGGHEITDWGLRRHHPRTGAQARRHRGGRGVRPPGTGPRRLPRSSPWSSAPTTDPAPSASASRGSAVLTTPTTRCWSLTMAAPTPPPSIIAAF